MQPIAAAHGPDHNSMGKRILLFSERAFCLLAGLLMAGLIAVTVTDVFGRQFGRPLAAAFELTQVLVAAMFYVALPFVTLRREHVTVDLIPFRENGWTARSIGFLVDLISAGLLATTAFQLWVQAGTFIRFNTVMMFLRWPIAPIVQGMALLTALTAIACLIQAGLRFKFDSPSDLTGSDKAAEDVT